MSKRSSRTRSTWLTYAGFAVAAMWGVAVPHDHLLDLHAGQAADSDNDLSQYLGVDLDQALRQLLAQEAE